MRLSTFCGLRRDQEQLCHRQLGKKTTNGTQCSTDTTTSFLGLQFQNFGWTDNPNTLGLSVTRSERFRVVTFWGRSVWDIVSVVETLVVGKAQFAGLEWWRSRILANILSIYRVQYYAAKVQIKFFWRLQSSIIHAGVLCIKYCKHSPKYPFILTVPYVTVEAAWRR